ncbi:peptidase M23 [Salinithrix halophila]|uniref:Peptidase M23 n=2 Tax=Salinithrix halophila TaxID=1485204 RepID=A0ABV8J9S4_9BACL
MTKDEKWALGTAVILAPNVKGAYPEGWLFIARKNDQDWEVGLEGTSLFVDLAQKAPTTIVKENEKETFSLLGKDQITLSARTELRLPYTVGQSWIMSGGPHGWSGNNRPYSSIDLYGGDQRVLAARDGNAFTMCSNNRGWIRVYHDNGYATDYYHLWNNITPTDESFITEGSFLGYTGTDVSCGGFASGRHVHFSLLSSGNRVALDGKEIGGWVFFEGSAYDGYAMHGSTVRYPDRSLYNYGKLATNQGIVDANGGGTVNLRSGPGRGYPIIGSVDDGAIVNVSCTGRGSSFTGRWGSTNLWNQLANGQWMSDAFLYTGTNGPVAPSCY